MTQVYNGPHQNDLSSSLHDMLSLVNEQLVRPREQQRISNLKNYFLGYKEYSENPPSPTLSDEGQTFSYLEQEEQSNTILEPPIFPSCGLLLQDSREAHSQVNSGKANKSKFHPKPRLRGRALGLKTQRKGRRGGCISLQSLKSGKVGKAPSQSSHHMETRSRTYIRLEDSKATQMVEQNNKKGSSCRRQ